MPLWAFKLSGSMELAMTVCMKAIAMIGLSWSGTVAAQTPAHDGVAAATALETTGDVLGAAMTLERTLTRDPGNADARLLYSSLLCRLDNADGARAEIAKLEGSKFSDAFWAKVTAACGTLPRPHRTKVENRISGDISVGFGFDSDQLGALSVQFTVPGFNGPVRDGFSFIGAAKLNGKTRIGEGYAYGSASVRTKNDLSGIRSDYQLGEMTAGFGVRAVSGGFVVRHGRIVDQSFVTEYGAQAEVTVLTGSAGKITVRGEAVHQSYPSSTPALSRDGERFDLALVGEQQSRDVSWLGGMAVEIKKARSPSENYTGARAFIGARIAVGSDGRYVNLSTTYRYAKFRDSPPITRRIDHRLLTRASIGVPLRATGLIAEVAVSHTLRRFNAASGFRSFDNLGGEVRLIWKFGR
jgi:hypothetical protein